MGHFAETQEFRPGPLGPKTVAPGVAVAGTGWFSGDIVVERGNCWFYFPIVTCILISVVVSLVTRLIWALKR